MVAVPMEVESGQPMQKDLSAPRACQAEPQSSAQAHMVRGEAVGAGDVTAGDANHQAPAAGPEAEDVHNTQEAVANTTRIVIANGSSDVILNPSRLRLLQPDGAWLAAACAGLGGGEQADGEELTPGQRRKLSIELAGKRAALAETGAWTELLRLYVRDLLSREVDARGDGTHTLQQSTTLNTEGGHGGLLQYAGCFADTADQRARTAELTSCSRGAFTGCC